MAAMFDSHEDVMDGFVRALPVQEGQCGAAFAIGEQLVGLNLFDYQATLGKLLPKLVRSYALDALDAQHSGEGRTGAAAAEGAAALLALIGRAEAQRFPAVGEGEDMRLSAGGLTGAGLVARDRLVHLSAFCLETPERPAGVTSRSRLTRPSARRRH